jgi:N-acetylneuraminic acid mutarotase
VAGGQSGGYDSLAGAEIYDPFANTWKAAGSLGMARDSHVSTVLQNGKVLVVGGYGVAGYLASAEIYDPGTDTWSAAGNIGEGRVSHAAALMGNGKVLVTGGYGSDISDNAWTYDPAANSWSAAAPVFYSRIDHTMTPLANGKVLMAGGVTAAVAFSDTAEIYDPVANTWTPTRALVTGRSSHSAIALADGRVLIAGGTGDSGTLDSAEAYDAGTDTWSAAGTFDTGRYWHTMTLLNNGLVLAAGGINPAHGCLASAENGGAEAFTTEGVPVTQTGTFSDAEGNGTVTLAASSGTLTKDFSAGTWSWTRTDADGRVSPAVNITATDSAGTVTVASFTYMVANVAPVAALSGPVIVNEDTAVIFDFTATDVAAADQSAGFAWKLHFGDATDYVNLPAGTASPLSQAHTFAQPGTFTVKATATDKDGGVSAQVTQSITILDVTPPETTITSAPSGAVASTTAEIVFEASDNV